MVRLRSLSASSWVSAPSFRRHRQFPFAIPGKFIRASDPSSRRSCAGTMAVSACDAKRLTDQGPDNLPVVCSQLFLQGFALPAWQLPIPARRCVVIMGSGIDHRFQGMLFRELNCLLNLSRTRIGAPLCPGSEVDPVKPLPRVLWRRDHPRSKAIPPGLRGRLRKMKRLHQVGIARSEPSWLVQALHRCGQSR